MGLNIVLFLTSVYITSFQENQQFINWYRHTHCEIIKTYYYFEWNIKRWNIITYKRMSIYKLYALKQWKDTLVSSTYHALLEHVQSLGRFGVESSPHGRPSGDISADPRPQTSVFH